MENAVEQSRAKQQSCFREQMRSWEMSIEGSKEQTFFLKRERARRAFRKGVFFMTGQIEDHLCSHSISRSWKFYTEQIEAGFFPNMHFYTEQIEAGIFFFFLCVFFAHRLKLAFFFFLVVFFPT